MSKQMFTSDFSLGEQVKIDRDPSIVGTIIGVMFRHGNGGPVCNLEIAYTSNGELEEHWIESWRVVGA